MGSPSPADGEKHEQHSLRYGEEGVGIFSEPWLDATGRVVWSTPRIWICKVIDAQLFETMMAIVVVANIGLIVFETDLEARCFPLYHDRLSDCPYTEARSEPWVNILNRLLMLLYSTEAGLRLFVERRLYFRNSWNLLDLVIVSMGWMGEVFGSLVNVAFLRFFRVARLARALRVFIAFRELYLLLVGFLSAIRAIFWGGLMMFGMLLLWSIVMVQFVHPVSSLVDYGDCERCVRGFDTVMSAVLTLFQQIVVGDSWGTISIPLIEQYPWTGSVIVASTMTVSLGITNLILSVIVERAAEARERDLEEKLNQKRKEQEEQKKTLLQICQRMDDDGSGTLDVKELLAGYDQHEDFRNTLHMMDIQREELKAVFKVLDKDSSGDVDYAEFCDQLNQIRSRDTRTMLTFLKLSVSELKEEVEGFTEIAGKELKDMMVANSQTLQQMNDRLSKLDDGGALARLASGEEKLRPSGCERERLLMPVAPPQPWVPPDRPLSAESLMGDLQGLGNSTTELASLKGVIVKRLEDHVATLTRQAGMLASIGTSVQTGGWQSESSIAGFPDAAHIRIAEKVRRLQQNMQQDLAKMMREVDHKLEDGAATLARNMELLTSLSRDLGAEHELEQLHPQSQYPPRRISRGRQEVPAAGSGSAWGGRRTSRSGSKERAFAAAAAAAAGGVPALPAPPFLSCSLVGRAPPAPQEGGADRV